MVGKCSVVYLSILSQSLVLKFDTLGTRVNENKI